MKYKLVLVVVVVALLFASMGVASANAASSAPDKCVISYVALDGWSECDIEIHLNIEIEHGLTGRVIRDRND